MRKIGLLAICVMVWNCLLGQPTFGQRFEQVTSELPSAPNASAIDRYGGVNINLNKGMLSHTFPLYELKVKSMAVPFSLNYAANGLKVDEYASRVGFNWTLEAGGVVSRTVYGYPDEGSQRLEMPASGPQTDTAFYNFLTKATGGASYDPQPDVFTYSFAGVSGKFVLDKNKAPVTLDGSPIKIETNFSSSDWNFKITNLDGSQFFFGGSTATEETRTENTCGKPYVSYVPTSWYVKKIVTVHGQEIIFDYAPIEFLFYTGYSMTTYYDHTPNLFCADTASDESGTNPQTPVYCISYSSQATTCAGLIRSKGKYLTGVSASGIASIEFQTAFTRQDCADVLYTGMTIKDPSGQVTNQYQFDYTILQGDRPFLTKVRRMGKLLSPFEDTRFSYNPGELPALNSFSQDHYGYYNGSSNANLFPLPELFSVQDRYGATADREPNPFYASMGMLSKIIYPTGGSDTILYEGNDFNEYKQVLPPRDTIEVSATGPAYKQTTTVTSDSFVVGYGQEARVEISIDNVNPNNPGGGFDPVHDRGTAIIKTTTGEEVFYWNDNPGLYSKTIKLLPAGNYVVEVSGTGNGIKTTASLICRVGNPNWAYVNTLSAGVRVKKVITAQPGMAVQQVKMYNYRQIADTNKSSGGAQAAPDYLYYFNNRQFCNNGVAEYLYCNYSGMFSSSRVPVLLYEGGASYANVAESWGENAENGIVQHIYLVSPQTPANQAGLGGGFLVGAPMTNSGTLNGKEVETLVYANNGGTLNLVKKTEYSHKTDSRGYQLIEATAVNKNYNNDIVHSPLTSVDFEGYDVARYAHIVNWTYVDTVRETQYTATGLPSIKVSTIYQYDNATHRQLTKTTTQQSDGRIEEAVIRYPLDFSGITAADAASAAIKNLQTRSIINAPVEQTSSVANSDGSNRELTSARFALYDNSETNLREVWQVEGAPIGDFVSASVISGAVNTDSRYKKQVLFDVYDAKGNVLQQSRLNDVKLSYIWGYDGQYPIAGATNALQKDIFHTSFEDADGNSSVGDAKTGEKSRTGGYSKSLTGLTNGNYSLVYWQKSGGNWSLQSSVVTVSGGSYTITLTGQVDEVRFYPVGAQMTTYTYQPLVGMISQTDINNRITYYEYDPLGRLTLVRDQDKNILKKVCYNYFGQAEDCGLITYSSVAKSGSFTRNNCGTNGTGSSVTYMVAAGTYTSIISQADADQKAQNDVDTNGQAYANANGSCTWTNQAQSGNFTRNNCGTNGTGSTVTYTIAAGTYSSTVSLADANQQAVNAVNAGGQAYANANAGCTWVSQVQSDNFTRNNCGTNGTGSTVTYTVEAGSYSSTISLADANQQAINAVNAGGQAYANANAGCTWTNQQQSGSFTRDNCGTNGTGGTMTYYVNADTYSSTISLADANQQAVNAVNAGGQAYVNTNGGCTWTNQAQSGSFTRNNCTDGGTGGTVTYNVTAGTYSSTVSLADANQQAVNAVNAGGQAYANANASCTWSNIEQSAPFTRNNCGPQYTGSTVTYKINAGTYISTVSQADANQLAINAMNAGGQAYANSIGTCTPVPVYVKLVYENIFEDVIMTTADLVLKFYSDAACTVPYSVSSMSVNYQEEKSDCNGMVYETNSYTQGNCNGTSVLVASGVMLLEEHRFECWQWAYTLLPGTGYTLINN